MTQNLPEWAIRRAGPEDRNDMMDAFNSGTAVITWPDTAYLRSWAKQRGWPTPIVGFRSKFVRKMLSSDDSYYRAISGSGIEIRIPVKSHKITDKRLREMDQLYESRGEHGYPDCWDPLVEGLREIRRACEANIHVIVDGKTLNARNFYSWAHGRYHMLEDGCDKWIGNDD
jgi:hypothetical protein